MSKNDNEKQFALEKIMDLIISVNSKSITTYVNKFKEQNKNKNIDEIAKIMVKRKSFKNGLVGAIAGLGGLITLPVSVPADLIASWRIQSMMVYSIAYLYGHTSDTLDLKTDMYIILAGDSAKEALKRVGIEVAKSITKKTVEKYINREIMKKIWKVIGQKIITKACQKSMTSFMNMVPLVGSPVGFIFDWSMCRTVGRFAIKYYSGEK